MGVPASPELYSTNSHSLDWLAETFLKTGHLPWLGKMEDFLTFFSALREVYCQGCLCKGTTVVGDVRLLQ